MIAPLFTLAGAVVPVLTSVVTPCAIPAIAYPPGQPPSVVVEAEQRCKRNQQVAMLVVGALGLTAAASSTNTAVRSMGIGAAASAALLLVLASVPSRKATTPTPATPGAVLVMSQRALSTGSDPGGRPALLSTPPVPLTMGTMGGNVHVRIQRLLSPDRAIGVVVGIESTSDVPPFKTAVLPVAGEPTIEFDPRPAV